MVPTVWWEDEINGLDAAEKSDEGKVRNLYSRVSCKLQLGGLGREGKISLLALHQKQTAMQAPSFHGGGHLLPHLCAKSSSLFGSIASILTLDLPAKARRWTPLSVK